MKNLLKIWQISWIHFKNPTKQELREVEKDYDLHEIIIDDILEYWVQDKIDTYDNNIFMVFHFPKYDTNQKRYFSNEFSVILWKDYIITFTSHHTNHIEKIKQEYINETKNLEDPEKYKISPYYILYKIIDVMYDKTLRLLNKSARDIMILEEEVFSKNWLSKKLLEDLMIKRRNLVFIKHMFLAHSEVLDELHKTIENFYDGQFDMYFEDLIYKWDKINSNISALSENIASLSEIYNNLMNIRLNWVMWKLTAFTFIIWVNTLIVWAYWMNVDLPWDNYIHTFSILSLLMILISIFLWYILNKKWWFD